MVNSRNHVQVLIPKRESQLAVPVQMQMEGLLARIRRLSNQLPSATF